MISGEYRDCMANHGNFLLCCNAHEFSFISYLCADFQTKHFLAELCYPSEYIDLSTAGIPEF